MGLCSKLLGNPTVIESLKSTLALNSGAIYQWCHNYFLTKANKNDFFFIFRSVRTFASRCCFEVPAELLDQVRVQSLLLGLSHNRRRGCLLHCCGTHLGWSYRAMEWKVPYLFPWLESNRTCVHTCIKHRRLGGYKSNRYIQFESWSWICRLINAY